MRLARTFLTIGAIGAALLAAACRSGGSAGGGEMKEIAAHDAGSLRVVLLSPGGDLAQGDNQFRIAFRTPGGEPVDVGSVTLSSSMAMPGMTPMVAPVELAPTRETGQYAVKGRFGMSGAWQFEVRWSGAAGQGSASFSVNVR
jgi:hypothetical protein